MLPAVLLLLTAIVQVSVINFDLIILVLIARSFLVSSRSNYYLAFGMGILISILSGELLGTYSLLYLFVVKVVQIFRKSTLSENWIATIPLASLLLLANILFNKYVFGVSLNFNTLIVQLALLAPVYLVVAYYDERLSVREQIKLKI